MFKRGCFLGVLSILSCMFMACDSDNSPKNECEIDADCLDFSLDTRRGCYLISGVRVCQNSCLGRNEGDNAPVCYQPLSASSEPQPTVSVTDTCAKDEEDRLYSAHSEREFCSNYCNKKTGLCKTADEVDECENDGQCAEPDAGTNKKCFRISGVRTCMEACLGSKEGKNDPVCYLPSTIDPPPEPNVSVTDTCAKDDVGRLYVVDTVHESCPNYCDEATGLCKAKAPDLKCCEGAPEGDRALMSFSISGECACKFRCLTDSEGTSEPFCYAYTMGAPVSSTIEECAKDDYGKLYSIHTTYDYCKGNGCDEDTGLCTHGSDPVIECSGEDEIKCNPPGSDPMVCTVIDGKIGCKDACHGDAEGKNAAVCYVNGSLDPNVAPQYSIVSTCKKDDNGVLYATKNDKKQCDNGCDEAAGVCKTEVPVTECKKDCMMDGGDPTVCVIIKGEESCATACFGKAEGKNEPVCYQNGSIGPDSPYYSIIDTCKKDDIGTLYSDGNEERKKCDNGCDKTTGECILVKPSDEDCSKLDCNVVGGRTKTCVMISGKPTCENTCLATAEGVNEPVCYKNGALGPSAKDNSAVDTCAKDDDGKLYSVSTEMTECSDKCEDGVCK